MKVKETRAKKEPQCGLDNPSDIWNMILQNYPPDQHNHSEILKPQGKKNRDTGYLNQPAHLSKLCRASVIHYMYTICTYFTDLP